MIKQLPEKLVNGFRRFEYSFWIDFVEKQSDGCQRWFPDDVTLILIARLLAGYDDKQPLQSNHLTRAVAKMLNSMGESYSKKLTISPQVFTMFSPISWNSVTGQSTVNRHMGFLVGSAFTGMYYSIANLYFFIPGKLLIGVNS